jgi:hypothetical protein
MRRLKQDQRYCDRTLHLLLRTFFDIIRLQKGPEHIPGSALVLLLSFGLLVFATFCSTVLIDNTAGDNIVLSFLASLLGYVFYWFVLIVTGFSRRFVPTISSIMACGSILTVFMVFAYVMFTPFLGANFASIIATLILFWSVPVKGHIIARAIERHWYIGIAIAMTIFLLQFAIYSALTGQN